MNIHLHIEELVLHGFSPGDRYRIAESAQSQLVSLLTEKGVPAALAGGGRMDLLNAGSFHVGTAARPEGMGAQIAAAVYGGLGSWASE